jgi:hypothetical protein
MNFLSDDLNLIQDEAVRLYGTLTALPDPFTLSKINSNNVTLGTGKIGFIKTLLIIGTGNLTIADGQGKTYIVPFTNIIKLENIWVKSITNITGLTYLSIFGYIINYNE